MEKILAPCLEMFKSLICVLVITSALICDASRKKRFLAIPPTSPTRHQLISGIGVPLELEDESIVMGIVLKAQYFLVSFPASVNFDI